MPFLENVTRGRGVPRERLLDVAHHYELFGGVSPINEQNRALIAALEPELRAHGIDLPVYFGNRNWRPFIADAMSEMRDDGVRNALAFLTSAYSSYSGCRQYRENLFDAQQAFGPDAPAVSRLRMLYNHPGLRRGERGPRARRARAGSGRFAHRVHGAFDPRCDGAQLRVRGATARDRAARRRGGRRRAAGRSSTSRAAGRRRCRGSSRTSPIISWRSRTRARRALSSPRSGSSRITSRCSTTWTSKRAKRRSGSGLPLVRARAAGTHPAFVAAIREAIDERLDPGDAEARTRPLRPELGHVRARLLPARQRPALALGRVMPSLGRRGRAAARALVAHTARRQPRRCRLAARRRAGAAPVVGRAPARRARRRGRAGGCPCGALGAARARQGVDAPRDAPPASGDRAAAVACGPACGRPSRTQGLPAGATRTARIHPPLDAEHVAAVRAAVRDVLDGRCLLREEIVEEVVARVGPAPRARLGSGFAFFLGDLCQGPPRGAKVTFVRPDQWVEGWHEPDESEALREACRRFLHAYGPARPVRLPRMVRARPAECRRRSRALRVARARRGRRRRPERVRPRRRHRIPGGRVERPAAARVRRVRDGLPRA